MLGDDVCGNFIQNNIDRTHSGPQYPFMSSVPVRIAVDFSLWALVSAHHAPLPNFDITLFRPHTGVQPELNFLSVFSHTVSNSHSYGVIANFTKTH